MTHPGDRDIASLAYRLLIAVGGITVSAFFAIVFVLTQQIDAQAASSAKSRVELVLSEWEASLSLAVEDYAFWTFAYEVIRSGNDEEIYSNIGSGAEESDMFDALVIVPRSEAVPRVYGLSSDEDLGDLLSGDPETGLLASLSRSDPADHQSHSRYLWVGDSLFRATAAWVTPDEYPDLDNTSLPLLIGLRRIDDDKLQALATAAQLRSIALTRQPTTGPEGLDWIRFGQVEAPIALLSWQPPMPGQALRQQALPWVALISAAVFGILLVVAGHVRYLSKKLLRAIKIASTDMLTGIGNRVALASFLDRPEVAAAVSKGQIAILNIDLNAFKGLNDTYGHHVGDEALKLTSRRLESAIRATDLVVRIGGDEFLCVIVDPAPVAAAEEAARRINALFETPARINGNGVPIGLSIGLATGRAGGPLEETLRQADRAMFAAKTDLKPIVSSPVSSSNLN